jgi:hypothetical protein
LAFLESPDKTATYKPFGISDLASHCFPRGFSLYGYPENGHTILIGGKSAWRLKMAKSKVTRSIYRLRNVGYLYMMKSTDIRVAPDGILNDGSYELVAEGELTKDQVRRKCDSELATVFKANDGRKFLVYRDWSATAI